MLVIAPKPELHEKEPTINEYVNVKKAQHLFIT